jgi:hypothetical protein
LIKDLLKLEPFKSTLKEAQSIAKAFKKAPLQHARLHEYQIQTYGKAIAFVLSVLTRWGTQCGLVNSVLKNKEALRLFAKDFTQKDLAYDAHKYISDSGFWEKLSLLHELLKPLDEAITMSESNKAHLGMVIGRWNNILKHLTKMKNDFPILEDFLVPEGPFITRFKRQIEPIHHVAYFLDPTNIGLNLPANTEKEILQFFREYVSTEGEAEELMMEFADFRCQMDDYAPTRWCWKMQDKPIRFWQWIQQDSTKMLPKLAVRIFGSPANSVTSERAFSTQNFLHDKVRNALQSERVNKLIFIYMNQRVLRQIQDQTNERPLVPNRLFDTSPLHNLTEAEEVELENAMVEDGELLIDDELDVNSDESEMDFEMMMEC